jgi:hypothetical protein
MSTTHTTLPCYGQSEKSAVAEHAINTGHKIQFVKPHNHIHGPCNEKGNTNAVTFQKLQ